MKRTFFLSLLLIVFTVSLNGCSGGSSEGDAHQVKDLKARGLKDPTKDDMKMAKRGVPGQKN